jgi:hypothetical protein
LRLLQVCALNYFTGLAKGEIASLSGAGDDPRYFQISAPVQPGNSGLRRAGVNRFRYRRLLSQVANLLHR